MEAESIPSLSPLIESADQWGEWLLLLPLLVALEAVLSADNAIALAAISRQVRDPGLQGKALNFGLGLALVLRLGLIAVARWVLDFWPLQLLAAGYLLWLCCTNLAPLLSAVLSPVDSAAGGDAAGSGDGPADAAAAGSASGSHPPHDRGLAAVVTTLALTDLAFSLDSVAAAVAVSDNLLLVMAGGFIGVVALRLTSGLFIRWLGEYAHLETAGYLAVGLVGIRLLVRLALPQLVPPEWLLLASVALLFAWGFSKRSVLPAAGSDPAELMP